MEFEKDADKFVRKYKLKGFATGMIISDSCEAMQLKVPFSKMSLDQSNALFAKIIADNITNNKKELFEDLSKRYAANNNSVLEFNKNNFFTF